MAGTFRRYDPDAKLAIYYAAVLAPQRGQSDLSPEDLLLGITWRQHAPDCDFRVLKDDGSRLWEAVGMPHLPICAKPYEPSKLPLNAAAKRVLRGTKKQADRNGDYWIDIDHMLCALVLEGGAAGTALTDTGWTLERIREAGARGREKYPPKAVSQSRRWRTKVEEFFGGLTFLRGLLLGLAIYVVAALLTSFHAWIRS